MPCSGPTKFPVLAKYSSCARAVSRASGIFGSLSAGVGLRALTADVERDVGVHLASIPDRSYFAEHEPGCRIDCALNAPAAISLDTLQIELDKLLCGDLFGPDRAVHISNGRFLEVEARRGSGFCHERELRCAE